MTDDLIARLRDTNIIPTVSECGAAADALEAQSARIAALEAQISAQGAIAKFAGMVLKEHRNDGYPGDVDGAFLQETALECRLIEERTVSEPCGEMCTCAEVADFPTQCYFGTEAARAAIALSQSQASEGGA